MSAKYVKPRVLADRYDVNQRTLVRWSERGQFPRPLQVCGTTRYEASAVAAWEAEHCGDQRDNER